MNATIERSHAHPKADAHCRECRGSGYVLNYLDPLDPYPSTGVCRCVLRKIEQEGRQPLRHGRRV